MGYRDWNDNPGAVGGGSGLIVFCHVSETDIHDDADTTLNLVTPAIQDAGWSFALPNSVTFTGTPRLVKIGGNIWVPNGAGNYWARPQIRVFRNGVAMVAETDDLAMQSNITYSGNVTFALNAIDPTPATNPTYTFTMTNDDQRAFPGLPNSQSHVFLEAVL